VDYAQLLILNLLQMVAGSISTASLLFWADSGRLSLLLLLYCCLLFHLKQESDYAGALMGHQQPSGTSASLSLSSPASSRDRCGG